MKLNLWWDDDNSKWKQVIIICILYRENCIFALPCMSWGTLWILRQNSPRMDEGSTLVQDPTASVMLNLQELSLNRIDTMYCIRPPFQRNGDSHKSVIKLTFLFIENDIWCDDMWFVRFTSDIYWDREDKIFCPTFIGCRLADNSENWVKLIKYRYTAISFTVTIIPYKTWWLVRLYCSIFLISN